MVRISVVSLVISGIVMIARKIYTLIMEITSFVRFITLRKKNAILVLLDIISLMIIVVLMVSTIIQLNVYQIPLLDVMYRKMIIHAMSVLEIFTLLNVVKLTNTSILVLKCVLTFHMLIVKSMTKIMINVLSAFPTIFTCSIKDVVPRQDKN